MLLQYLTHVYETVIYLQHTGIAFALLIAVAYYHNDMARKHQRVHSYAKDHVSFLAVYRNYSLVNKIDHVKILLSWIATIIN